MQMCVYMYIYMCVLVIISTIQCCSIYCLCMHMCKKRFFSALVCLFSVDIANHMRTFTLHISDKQFYLGRSDRVNAGERSCVLDWCIYLWEKLVYAHTLKRRSTVLTQLSKTRKLILSVNNSMLTSYMIQFVLWHIPDTHFVSRDHLCGTFAWKYLTKLINNYIF